MHIDHRSRAAALAAAVLLASCGGEGFFGINLPPVADAGADVTGTATTAVSFDGSGSADPDGPISSFKWDFGDGASGDGEKVTHSYAAAGTFVVRLTVRDEEDVEASDEAKAVIALANERPTAIITGPSAVAKGAETIYDAAESTDVDGTIVAWRWEFSDGATATSKAVAHTFAALGAFTVKLVVTDNLGATGELVLTVRVQEPAALVPAESYWTWALVNSADRPDANCGAFQAAGLEIRITANSIEIIEGGGVGGSTSYTGTFAPATRAFSASHPTSGNGQETLRGTFAPDFKRFDGFYDIVVGFLSCNRSRAVFGTRQ